jgi:hypothetical protein
MKLEEDTKKDIARLSREIVLTIDEYMPIKNNPELKSELTDIKEKIKLLNNEIKPIRNLI